MFSIFKALSTRRVSVVGSSLPLPCDSSINAKLRLDRQNDPPTCSPGLNIM